MGLTKPFRNGKQKKLTDVTDTTVNPVDTFRGRQDLEWLWDNLNSVMTTASGCVLKLAGPCARAVLSKSCFPAPTVLGTNAVSVRWHKAPQDEFRTGVHKNTRFRIMHKLNDKTP